MPNSRRPPFDAVRYGIGEWYGESFAGMTHERMHELALRQALPKKDRQPILCPFQSYGGRSVCCNKNSGVCSTRQYRRDAATGAVGITTGLTGELRTLCPQRFVQAGAVFKWIGETIFNHPEPLLVKEVGFLRRPTDLLQRRKDSGAEDVGRIDHILVHPTNPPFEWCAVEMQAVYFSGDNMELEFAAIRNHTGGSAPFPAGRRRPDDRSSGPKRLMPQLQTKVPSLRRWGKKMAVVIDEGFFNALGHMELVPHVSNCDILWFVVRYEESKGCFDLKPSRVYLTTLEHSVEGLTGGAPVSKEQFEARILEKLAAQQATGVPAPAEPSSDPGQ